VGSTAKSAGEYHRRGTKSPTTHSGEAMSRHPVSISILCVLLGAASASAAPAARPATSAQAEFLPSIPKDTLPPWRYVDMTRVIVEDSSAWRPGEVQALELLAWYAKVDDRYVNVALFGVRLTRGRWAFVQLVQTPIPDPTDPPGTANSRTVWHSYFIFDVAWKPIAVFPAKPTARQVDAFLQWWNANQYGRVLSQGFRSQTWKAFLGLPAPRKLQALNGAGPGALTR
jgi:hypothetical protein